MGRCLLLGFLLVGACASSDLNLLESETLLFKEQNEELRHEDLLASYEKRKRQADALSEKLLTLQHQREEAYAEYDVLRGELARVTRDRAAAEEQRTDAQTALAAAQAESKRLAAELKKERAEIARLKADLEKMQAQIRALEAKKKTESAARE